MGTYKRNIDSKRQPSVIKSKFTRCNFINTINSLGFFVVFLTISLSSLRSLLFSWLMRINCNKIIFKVIRGNVTVNKSGSEIGELSLNSDRINYIDFHTDTLGNSRNPSLHRHSCGLNSSSWESDFGLNENKLWIQTGLMDYFWLFCPRNTNWCL